MTHLKSQAESVERGLEMVRGIDEERDVRYPLFLAEFAEKQQRKLCRERLKQPYV